MDPVDSQVLLKRYNVLLGLYERLEEISQDVYRLIQSGSSVSTLTPKLQENAELANIISEESQTIVTMKKTLLEKDRMTEREKALVRESEQQLAEAVNRVVEQESRSRELISKQGVKIPRR